MTEPTDKNGNSDTVLSSPCLLTYIEFYSGIGGWTMALHDAVEAFAPAGSLKLMRLAALDHSGLCAEVMAHNFPSVTIEKKRKRKVNPSIETLSLQQAHDWSADIWCMSPPCQPHTRQHENQSNDLLDDRSKSFLHLCDLLMEMDPEKLPKLILLENVVGFELSGSMERFRTVLTTRNFKTGNFHLNPTQVGIPNERPRYYCVAVMNGGRSTFLEKDDLKLPVKLYTSLPDLQIIPEENVTNLPQIYDFLDQGLEKIESLLVPPKILNSNSSWCFDIVTPDSQNSACFTSSYGRFVKGTGSVLFTGEISKHSLSLQNPQDRKFSDDWKDRLDEIEKSLRYFSGTEIARFMGFNESFRFPENISLKQQWKLLGNSLNVKLAAKMSELGLRHVSAGRYVHKAASDS
jgi:tRNA (cytosine38-C5)-methyltransferase